MNKELVNEQVSYWNKFYASNPELKEPSPFAKSIVCHLNENAKIIDLGCGNGRDSLFFKRNGLDVTAVDKAEVAINTLHEQHGHHIRFKCDDFILTDELKPEHFDYCYSRFTMHSIDQNQQDMMIENVYKSLKNDGLFFIEVRSIKDDIYGLGEEVERNAFIYNDHYRRFVVKEELEQELEKTGFEIVYAEEARGFAPFNEMDPTILRVIAKKK